MGSGQSTVACSSCTTPRFTVKQGSLEQWNFQNGWNWSHPIHVHMEEHQVIKGAPGLYGEHQRFYRLQPLGQPVLWSGSCTASETGVNLSREDTVRLTPRSSAPLRCASVIGRYVMHCHNVIREDQP